MAAPVRCGHVHVAAAILHLFTAGTFGRSEPRVWQRAGHRGRNQRQQDRKQQRELPQLPHLTLRVNPANPLRNCKMLDMPGNVRARDSWQFFVAIPRYRWYS